MVIFPNWLATMTREEVYDIEVSPRQRYVESRMKNTDGGELGNGGGGRGGSPTIVQQKLRLSANNVETFLNSSPYDGAGKSFLAANKIQRRQQGGIIIAGPGKNNITYIHKVVSCLPMFLAGSIPDPIARRAGTKDKEAGDDPEIEDILKACCS
ncbi:hypothetical protein Scep_004701 [Stephania cephalantha]|uniref:Uncharacterized protein n=1 Tax=Stephania cephalantha TaxID=152367 RepID=A0AAP0KSY8_9MAGN